jgi:hypothetical protein
MKLKDLVSDEDFQGLPEVEKAKVVESLAKGDEAFQGLPEEEQIKVLATITGGKYRLASEKGVVQTPAPVQTPQQLEGVDRALNLMKQGFTDFTSMIGGVGGAYGKAAAAQYGATFPKEGEIGQAFVEGSTKGRQAGESLVKPQATPAPQNISSKVYESAVKALGDPTSWIGGGVKNILGNLIGSATVSGTAEVTGELGAQTEQAITGKDTGVGRIIGAFGAVPSTAATQAIVAKGVIAPSKSIYQKYSGIGKDSVEMEKSLSAGAAKRLLERAAKEQGIEDIDAFVNDFNAIGQKINKQNVPLFVALADNPVIRSQFIANMKTDPDFRALVNKQLESLSLDIDKNADKLFGARFSPIPADSGVKIGNVKKRISDLDNRIEDLAFRVSPTTSQEELGSAIGNLVEAKKKLVMSEISPKYDALKLEAKQANIRLSPEASKGIATFIKENRVRDIFGKGTPLDQKIMAVTGKGEGLSFDDIDSLKRNINSLQRQNLSTEQARKINQLEEVVNEARKNLPEGYNQRLIDIDREYYEKLGVPFNVANINDIDAKKYAEQIAPVIIKNGSGLKQFIKAVGEDGYPVATNAVIADVYKYAVKDGKLNLRALAKYSKDKAEVINQIPGLKEELQSVALDQNKLFLAKANLDEAYKVQEKKLAQTFLNQQEGNLDFTAIANRATTDRQYLSKIMDSDLKNVSPETRKAVVNNIRRELVDKAYNSGEGLAFFTNPRNQFLVDKVFGKGYANQVKQVAKVSDNIAKLDVQNISDVISKDEIDALGSYARELGLPGLDLPYVTSTIRDRISSTTQKTVRLLSRVNTARVNQATRAQIQELLIDPDGLSKFNKVASTTKLDFNNPVSLRKITDAFAERVPLYSYQVGKTLDDEEQSQIPQEDFVGGEFY